MIVLLLGGASSGKSEVAESFAATLPPPVTYLATYVPGHDGPDPEMAARLATHRARRPVAWRTVEVRPDELPRLVASTAGTMVVDALGSWVGCAPAFEVDVAALCASLAGRAGDAVVVSDEVGLGVHPSTEAGRRFREVLGPVNAAVAAVADHAWLVVAGRVLELRDAPGVGGSR